MKSVVALRNFGKGVIRTDCVICKENIDDINT